MFLVGRAYSVLLAELRGPHLPESQASQLWRFRALCPIFPQEFEIELEGSQSLRILCYEKCYDKTKVNKDNNEIVDKIMGKGQIQVRPGCHGKAGEPPGGGSS